MRIDPQMSSKRLFDFLIILGTLWLILPVILVSSVLILLLEGRPIFFPHKRLGVGSKEFDCYKFRTMITNSDSRLEEYLVNHPDERAAWDEFRKLERDPRVTRFGRFLRQTKIDELPQIYNVLKGEMSVVGPRPVTRYEFTEKYGRWSARCFSQIPGITGLWQVSGGNRLTYRRRVALDLLYNRKHSICLDAVICVRTVFLIVSRKGL